jgi:hypothetical protein
MNDRVQVITTCTSRKASAPSTSPPDALPGFDPVTSALISAERLYAGEQHRRLMAGVDELRGRCSVDVWVVSAKLGLVFGEDRIETYDDTFAGLRADELQRRADELEIAGAFRNVAAQSCALTIVLAGNEYFDAARLSQPVEWGSRTIALVSPSRATEIRAHRRLRVISVGQADAKRWSLPLTLLKGEFACKVLSGLATGPRDESMAARADALVASLLHTGSEFVAC